MCKVILICGKTGSGKSTYADKLAARLKAVNISQDELMLDLFGAEVYYNEPGVYEKFCSKIEGYVKRKAGEAARAGAVVICENGFWERRERNELRRLYRDMQVDCELHYIDTPEEQKLRNTRRRNKEIGQGKTHFYLTDDKDIHHFFDTPEECEIDVRVNWENDLGI